MKGVGSPGEPESWISLHIYYHGDRDVVLLGAVRPLVDRLLQEGLLSSFFFVRYSLGGPHLRLRLLPRPGSAAAVRAAAIAAIEELLRRRPSSVGLPLAEIERLNQNLLRLDPNEHDGEIPPDNCWRERPFEPEVERYGGSDLLPHSLLFYALSSFRSLERCSARTHEDPAAWLAGALGLLRRHALGLSACGEELLQATRTPRVANADMTAAIEAKADRVFAANRASFHAAFEGDRPEAVKGPRERGDLDAGAALRAELTAAPPEVRRTIVTSQLHMTTNRLGLRNSDEIYLTRLLSRTLTALAEDEPSAWDDLDRALARRAADREIAPLGRQLERELDLRRAEPALVTCG